MTFDAVQPYILAGAGITFGTTDVSGTLNVAKGEHTVNAPLALPSGTIASSMTRSFDPVPRSPTTFQESSTIA